MNRKVDIPKDFDSTPAGINIVLGFLTGVLIMGGIVVISEVSDQIIEFSPCAESELSGETVTGQEVIEVTDFSNNSSNTSVIPESLQNLNQSTVACINPADLTFVLTPEGSAVSLIKQG